jgi:transposase
MEHLRPNPDNGILALENNVAERGMSAVVFGRKNHLVVGSAAGGTAAAVHHSSSETAKLNSLDPSAWHADIIARIPDYKITKVDDLLPWKWNG